jgi:hypothetical protein
MLVCIWIDAMLGENFVVRFEYCGSGQWFRACSMIELFLSCRNDGV